MDIKEESCSTDFCSENEEDTKDHIRKVKIETITNSSDIKPELEESSPCCSQNEEHDLMRFNETINESESETKVYIKEEQCYSEREDSCISDDIEDQTYEDFYSRKPPSLSKGVFSYTLDLSSTEDSENGVSLNMNNDSAKCESDRDCQGQECVVPDISPLESSVCSETSYDGKIVGMACSSKYINNRNCKPFLSNEYQYSYECNVLVLDGEEASKCNIQDKGLNQLSPLKAPKSIDDAKAIPQCSICNKVFTRLSSLKMHKLIHEGTKPHKCNICNKAFTESSSLKNHKLSHEGIRPYECNICNKAFTQLPNLKAHKLIHEGIKPHKCNICNTAFTQLSNLKRHKLSHQGIKPYKCNICNKAFTEPSNMKSHKLIHEGIKPHKCEICKRAFTQLSHLKTHKLIHEGRKPHNCNVCNKAFTQLSSLKRHILIHQDK